MMLYKILKYAILSIFKSANLCENADDPQPTKNLSKQEDLSRTEHYNLTLSELPSYDRHSF